MDNALSEYFKHHATIDVPTAESIGTSRAMLSYLVKNGELQRLVHGVYLPASEIADELVAVSCRTPLIVFSHETALALHKLHNRIPAIPSVTIPTGKRIPHSIENAVTVYHVRQGYYELGLSTANSFQGHIVPCYDGERTICDIIRSYSRIDEETYVNAIRNYAQWSAKNLPKLFDYAQKMGISGKVHKAMEVIL